MKGITLISDSFLIIALLAIMVIMSLFIWLLILTFNVESKFVPGGMVTTRDVELKVVFKPVIYDSVMSAFLEYEYQGLQMKKIMEAVAIQESPNIWLEGKSINASLVSESFLTPQINKDYMLSIGSVTLVRHGQFASQTVPLGVQKVSMDLFTLNGEEVPMQLFVVD